MTRAEFLKNIAKLIAAFPQYDLICFCFYRTPEQQLKEYEAGKSKVKFGKHQQWLAMDFCFWEDLDGDGRVDTEELVWKNDPRYLELGEYWESLGGTWGGRWASLGDIYHFEG